VQGDGRSRRRRSNDGNGYRSRRDGADAGGDQGFRRRLRHPASCRTPVPQTQARSRGSRGAGPTFGGGARSMSEREDFLKRWSRRKREAATSAIESGVAPEVESKRRASIDSVSLPSSGDATRSDAPKQEEGFDLKKLPSINSITAATDVRPF